MSYMLYFLVVAFAVAVVLLLHKRSVVKFNDRYPPIDDDEFVRRCGQGVNREIAIRVRRIVSSQLGIEYERVYPEQSFARDLDCD